MITASFFKKELINQKLMKTKMISLFSIAALVFGSACQKEQTLAPATRNETINEERSAKTSGTLWSDCILFNVVVAPNSFKPGAGNFDELYSSNNNFKNGVMSISESKPGDTDYNGGRWHVNMLKADVDPIKYSNACSVDDLDLNDFESTSTYFSCPLLPMHE
jgi:hypothetical protein